MMIKKVNNIVLIIIAGLFLTFQNSLCAQYLEDDPTPTQRIFYGGSLGLTFGTFTNISIDPIVGYRITNRLSAGVGGNYVYLASKQFDYAYSLWGGNVFASFTVIKSLQDVLPFASQGISILLHGEYNMMNVSSYYKDLNISGTWQENPMLGLAIQSRIGKKSYAVIQVLFNFNEHSYSIYRNPVIKFSLQF